MTMGSMYETHMKTCGIKFIKAVRGSADVRNAARSDAYSSTLICSY